MFSGEIIELWTISWWYPEIFTQQLFFLAGSPNSTSNPVLSSFNFSNTVSSQLTWKNTFQKGLLSSLNAKLGIFGAMHWNFWKFWGYCFESVTELCSNIKNCEFKLSWYTKVSETVFRTKRKRFRRSLVIGILKISFWHNEKKLYVLIKMCTKETARNLTGEKVGCWIW